MKYGSVCSGIETASKAWEPLGWEPQFFSEIEPFPCHVLNHHWSSGRPHHMPDPHEPGLSFDDAKERRLAINAVNRLPEKANGVPNLGDMTQFQKWSPDYAIDLLVGGTPCQSYSVAGLREGLDDPRGDLMLTYAAIARRYRPSWLVWENVVGVLSSDEGRAFGTLLGLLSGRRVEVPADGWKTSGFIDGYKSAYGLAWRVLDTQFVRTQRFPRAIPQRRRRVFIVGYLGDWRRAAAVFLEWESLQRNPAPSRKAGQNPAGTISARAGASRSGGLGTDFDLDGGLVPEAALSIDASMGRRRGSGMNPNQIVGVPEVGNTLTHRMHKGVNTTMDEGQTMIPVEIDAEAAATLRGEGFDATEDGSGRTTLVPVAYRLHAENSNALKGHGVARYADETDVARSLDTTGGFAAYQGGNVIVGEVAPTLRAGGNSTGGDRPPGADVDTVESLIAFDTTQITSPHNRSQPKAGDASHTLPANGDPPAIAYNEHGHAEWNEADAAGPIRAGNEDGQGGARSSTVIAFDATAGGDTGFAISEEVSGALRAAAGGKGGHQAIAFNARQDPTPVPDEVSGPLDEGGYSNAIAFSAKNSGEDSGDVSPTLRAMSGEHANAGGQAAVAFQPRFARNDRGGPSDVAYPLTAEAGRTGKGDSAQAVYSPGWRVRRLTPPECSRLQGHADNHCLIPWAGRPAEECPDGPQYKGLGNSMSVNVMEWIGTRIQAVQDLIDGGAI